jgi:hypothetical protein
MHYEIVNYRGWPTCARLSDGPLELIVTGDVGPRIIRFGFTGGANSFAEFPADLGQTGGEGWRAYGGHRLWHAPEAMPRTYSPDNAPVAFEPHDGFLRVVQPVELATGIQKEMDISLAGGRATVVHRLRNHTLWPVELAPWALTMMAPGGEAILPLPPRGPHPENLTPVNTLALWAYTDLADPRWTWGTHAIRLKQDPASAAPQKIGMLAQDGWLAYWRAGELFIKTFDVQPAARYPDLGCNVEVFTNELMLELETLGPVTTLEPGAAVEHAEGWRLIRDAPYPATEADIAREAGG